MIRVFAIAAFVCLSLVGASRAAPPTPPPSFDLIERRAFDFFWYETDARTGLTKDRATNRGDVPDTRTVASLAATGYALAALPIGVTHGWVSREGAYTRALTTLRFLADRLPQNHGFYYHFVEMHTGERVWNCEISSADTALLVLGALAAGDYWPHTDVQRLANTIADRIDWRWMQNEDGQKSTAAAPTMGWTPEHGFLAARWRGYSEAAYLYWLGLGNNSPHTLSVAAYDAWTFPEKSAEGETTFGAPSPLFMAQMAPGFFDVRGQRDRLNRDWWAAWTAATHQDIAYCAAHPQNRTYAAGFWGITASDTPDGYAAQSPADGRNDGTVAPSAMLASIASTPNAAQRALTALWTRRDQLWGRYGFSDAFNLQRDWFDRDVIGIDLGMMLLLLENARTGLIWRLLRDDPTIQRGQRRAGMKPIKPFTRPRRQRV